MKFKVFSVLILIGVVIIGATFLPTASVDYDYLRLHIRANSNSEIDQNVKYQIKDLMVDYLTPLLCEVESKEEAIDVINENKQKITTTCINYLTNKGFSYGVNVKINNEYFPTRTYQNTTLESGYYDAVIVELGQAEGDNWWCVMYPPLCFVNKFENNKQITFKSKIKEWFFN